MCTIFLRSQNIHSCMFSSVVNIDTYTQVIERGDLSKNYDFPTGNRSFRLQQQHCIYFCHRSVSGIDLTSHDETDTIQVFRSHEVVSASFVLIDFPFAMYQ